MKPQMALKPMVFALAALMAAAAQAGGGWHPAPQPTGTGAAVVTDTQKSEHNKFDDTKTENNASADGSVTYNSGNVGVVNQAGSGNQGDNDVAIMSGKGDFLTVFSVIDSDQSSQHNNFINKGTQTMPLWMAPSTTTRATWVMSAKQAKATRPKTAWPSLPLTAKTSRRPPTLSKPRSTTATSMPLQPAMVMAMAANLSTYPTTPASTARLTATPATLG